jgi:hypothetical protein
MRHPQVKWSVKLRHLGWHKKNSRIIFVYCRTRDEARKAALSQYEKYNGIDFSMYACEASKVKGA